MHLAEVAVRMKEIQYSFCTRAATRREFRQIQKLRAAFQELLVQMPPELAIDAAAHNSSAKAATTFRRSTTLFNWFTARPTYKGESKDYEFSRQTMEEHWSAGHRDAMTTLAHPEVLSLPK